MSSSQLQDFVDECRKKNIPDDVIIKSLKEHKWNIEIIQQVLNVNVSINRPDKDAARTESVVDYVPKTDHILIIRIVTIFLFLISGLYFASSFGMTALLLMMDYSVTKTFSPLFVVIKAIPILGLLPIIMFLGGLIAVYSGIQIKKGSKSSFWFGLMSLVVIIAIFLILQIVTTNSMIKIQTNSNQL